MITAILLIVVPGFAWNRIASGRKSIVSIVLFFLLPMLIVAALAEGYGLVHYGKEQWSYSYIRKFPRADVFIFETAQILATLGIIFLGASVVKVLGETFHGRHTYHQAFTAVAYGLSPLFLLRVAVMIPGLYAWIPWIIGIALSIGALYIGIPRIMEPDPPHAFGLYVMSSILLFFATGLLEIIVAGYIQGNFKALSNTIAAMGKHLPF